MKIPGRLSPFPLNLWVWVLAVILGWGIELSGVFHDYQYLYEIAVYAGISVILAVSLNLVNGFTGQFSMGHAGFMSVGGYASAVFTIAIESMNPGLLNSPATSGLIFFAALIFGGLAAAVAGYVVGLPSLRLKGDYLAIVTLGFGEIIRVIALNTKLLGEARGLSGIPALTNFGWIATWGVITLFVVWRILDVPQGRAFLAVREDEIAAEAMGVNSTQAKVRAFALGAFFAGVAGVLFAHKIQAIEPKTFDFNRSFEIITMVVLGGSGSITGSVVAAVLLTFLREALRNVHLPPDVSASLGFASSSVDLRMVAYSFFLIVLMLTRPNGLFGRREIIDFFPSRFQLWWWGSARGGKTA